MGEQVAQNTEQQMRMYLKEDKGEWYILSEPKSQGLIRKEYIPIGNSFVYPKKWGREKAVEVFLNHHIEEVERMKVGLEDRLTLYNKLKDKY